MATTEKPKSYGSLQQLNAAYGRTDPNKYTYSFHLPNGLWVKGLSYEDALNLLKQYPDALLVNSDELNLYLQGIQQQNRLKQEAKEEAKKEMQNRPIALNEEPVIYTSQFASEDFPIYNPNNLHGINLLTGKAHSQSYNNALAKTRWLKGLTDMYVDNHNRAVANDPNFVQNWDMANNIMEFGNVATAGMLNRLSLTLNARLLYDWYNGKDINPLNYGSSWWGNNGIVSNKFALEHPYWSFLINSGSDGIIGGLTYLGITNAPRYTHNLINSGKQYIFGRYLNRIPLNIDNYTSTISKTGHELNNIKLSLPPKTKLLFYQRPSKLTVSERAGVPKIERNQTLNVSVNPIEEFKKNRGFEPQLLLAKQEFITDLLPNQLPKKFNDAGIFIPETMPHPLKMNKKYISLLQEYINTLPEITDLIDPEIIIDYRSFLNRNNIPSRFLSDLEISKLITSQYETLTSQMTGKLKGVPLFHGSYTPVEQFNFLMNTGKGLLNMGAIGPGNYFSTGRHKYGLVYPWYMGKHVLIGDMQPYLINNVLSTPLSATLQYKGLIPEYKSPPHGYETINDAKLNIYKNKYTKENLESIPRLEKMVNDYVQSPEYQNYVKENILPFLKESDLFIIDTDASFTMHPGFQTVTPLKNGTPILSIEGMIPRNTGIKSLFPHPNTLLRNINGNLFINRDWNDIRVNYRKGGKIKKFKKEKEDIKNFINNEKN